MSARTAPPTMVSVYSGRDCLGFVLSRGCNEAFATDERSFGLFPNQRDAANAVVASQIPEQSGMRASALSPASQIAKDSNHD